MVGTALWNAFATIGLPPAAPSWSDVSWGSVVFAVFALQSFFALNWENRLFKDRRDRKVRLVHAQNKKPYYVREANMGNGLTERRHLVGVINESGVKVSALRVVTERFEPYQQGATWISAPLNPLRGTPNNGGLFDVMVGDDDGRPTQYVEVFQELKGVPGCNDAILSYIYNSSGLNDLRRYVSGDWFAVVMRLEGDIKPCRFKLVAHKNHNTGWFDVAEGDLSVETMSDSAPAGYQVVTLSVAHTAAPPEAEIAQLREERDNAKADGIAIGRLSGDVLAAELRAAKEAAEARLRAVEQVGQAVADQFRAMQRQQYELLVRGQSCSSQKLLLKSAPFLF